MNACISKVETDEEREKREWLEEIRRINRQIDKELNIDSKKKLSCLKLLLLGTGESGKSTIIKQMKIIHVNGFSNQEKIEFIPIIRKNVCDAMLSIVVSMNKLQIIPKNFDISQKIQFLQKALDKDYDYPDEFFNVVTELWKDGDVQLCYSRSNEFQLIDSAKYFLDQIHIIRQKDYVPSLQDILRSRKMTNGITEMNFEVRYKNKNKVKFKVLDVGGQQGERKRWIQLFGDVTAILFLTDCSNFDKTLREDSLKNRLIDSLEVFYQAWMNRYLQNVPIIVFINKIDLLELKIRNQHSIKNMIKETLNFSSLQSNTDSLYINRRNSFNYINHNTDIGSFKDYSKFSETVNDSINLKNMNLESNSHLKSFERKISIRTMPSYNSRRFSKDSHFEAVAQIFSEHSWDNCQPTNDERKEFINSFPLEQIEFSHSAGKKKSKDFPNIHPETIRTACFIRNIYAQITRKQPKNCDMKTFRRRKCLFYYTCAVNTDNIQKVLDGCRSFLMEEHLERFGIL